MDGAVRVLGEMATVPGHPLRRELEAQLHHPVERWVKPEEFVELNAEAEAIGFAGVMSGPLVRSSYRAGRLYEQARAARTITGPAGCSITTPVTRPSSRTTS